MTSSDLQTVSRCQAYFLHSDFLNTGHFSPKKTSHTPGCKKLKPIGTFSNLWRIDAIDLYIHPAKNGHPASTCCRDMLPQSFENRAKGGPQ